MRLWHALLRRYYSGLDHETVEKLVSSSWKERSRLLAEQYREEDMGRRIPPELLLAADPRLRKHSRGSLTTEDIKRLNQILESAKESESFEAAATLLREEWEKAQAALGAATDPELKKNSSTKRAPQKPGPPTAW
ncbi:MAG: hypothetical protein ACAH95_05980 [Fimbriimonas sp.]